MGKFNKTMNAAAFAFGAALLASSMNINAGQSKTLRTGWLMGGTNPTKECHRMAIQAYGAGNYNVLQEGESARWRGTFGRTRVYQYWCYINVK